MKLRLVTNLIITFFLMSCASTGNRQNFTFLSYPCENRDAAGDDYSNLGVSKIQWIDPTTLKIDALVLLNCSYKITDCKLDIEGNDVV